MIPVHDAYVPSTSRLTVELRSELDVNGHHSAAKTSVESQCSFVGTSFDALSSVPDVPRFSVGKGQTAGL